MLTFFWNYFDTLFPLFALGFLLAKRRYWRGYSLLLAYLVMTVLLMGVSNALADRRINNMYLYHVYALVETELLLPLICSFAGIRRKAAVITTAFFSVFWLVYLIFWESLQQFNSNTASFSALLVAGFSFGYFFILTRAYFKNTLAS